MNVAPIVRVLIGSFLLAVVAPWTAVALISRRAGRKA